MTRAGNEVGPTLLFLATPATSFNQSYVLFAFITFLFRDGNFIFSLSFFKGRRLTYLTYTLRKFTLFQEKEDSALLTPPLPR